MTLDIATTDLLERSWPIVSHGGQHVGVSSGVLLVHVPSGVAFVANAERSQMKNRAAARDGLMRLLALCGAADVGELSRAKETIEHWRPVVEAAKRWRTKHQHWDDDALALCDFCDAVDALLATEAP